MILDRHIGFSFLSSFLFSLCAFTLIFALTELFQFSKYANQESSEYLYYYILFSLPHLISQALAIALMFGSCFSINQFHLSSELIAVYSAGRSFYRTVLFPLLFSFALGLAQLGANQFFFNSLKAEANRYKVLLVKGSHRFSKKEIRAKNLRGKEGFYYINYFDRKSKNIYGGFTYLQLDKEDRPLHFYEAKNASYRLVQKDWLLTDVRIIHFNLEIQVSAIESKASLALQVPEKVKFFAKASYFPDELGLDELYQEIQKSAAQGSDVIEYIIEFHTRLVFPINCFLLCFIGTVGGASGKRRSGSSFTQALFLSTITILIYYMGFTICRSMAISGVLHPAFTSWLPVSIYLGIALYLLRK